jgi:regulator of replication initiation timing
MEDSFSQLEERIKRAVEEVQRLRIENTAIKKKLEDAQRSLPSVDQKTRASETRTEDPGVRAHDAQEMNRELATLRRERQEIRSRIAKLVDILDQLG